MYLTQVVDEEGRGLTERQTDAVLFGGNYERVNKCDYAIVLGTSPEYAVVRAEIAAAFYRKGGTENIIVSGAAVADKTVTEAAFLHGELVKRGVPQSAIIEEPNAYDTVQNMTCSLTEICKRTDIMRVKSVTVITEPFHMRRSLCLARLLLPGFIEIYGYTQGVARQRDAWKSDARLRECVRIETIILRQLAMQGRIQDVELSKEN